MREEAEARQRLLASPGTCVQALLVPGWSVCHSQRCYTDDGSAWKGEKASFIRRERSWHLSELRLVLLSAVISFWTLNSLGLGLYLEAVVGTLFLSAMVEVP